MNGDNQVGDSATAESMEKYEDFSLFVRRSTVKHQPSDVAAVIMSKLVRGFSRSKP